MDYDLIIIGGGINGCSIARDAAGRGLKTLLAEKNDLASGTSSASTKLIHGGLRYLEYYKFRLVHEALSEREILLKSAPHIIWPLRFVLPHHNGLRPRWLIRLGLFIYDHLGGRKILPATRSLNLRSDVVGEPLKPEFTKAFEYSDCAVDDSRFVVLNARDAADRGAIIRTRTKLNSARPIQGGWTVDLTSSDGKFETITAKVLVNAGGPWVSEVLSSALGRKDSDKIRLVKGSHIVVDKLYEHDRCYIFQNADGRICFAIPYENSFTLIGTTDEDHQASPETSQITQVETDYLLKSVSAYFKKPVTFDMIKWSFSGIRPLYDDGASTAQEATRDYVLKLDGREDNAPVLSVFGGKITTSRRLAEHAMQKLIPFLPDAKPAWTTNSHLPGGNIAYADVSGYIEQKVKEFPFLERSEILRLFRAYGTKMELLLASMGSDAQMGIRFGPLSEREIRYLIENEWAQTADDILWRRSKLGLHLTRGQQTALDAYMTSEARLRFSKNIGTE